MAPMTSATTQYEIKTPSAVLAEDVICQSFIQSSSTLAYACLLIRRGRHDLAVHVLHSLEGRPASRFKDMVFYLQCQIGIEVGDFAAVKKRLVPRVHQHPNDMVAVSLLESCVFLEYEDWQRRNPLEAAEELVARTQVEECAVEADPRARLVSSSEPVLEFQTLPGARFPDVADPSYLGARVPSPNYQAPLSDGSGTFQALERAVQPVAIEEKLPSASPPANPASDGPNASSAPGENDLGIYQALASDANTQALCLWNAHQRRRRSFCRNPALEPLVAALPQSLPQGLEDAVRDLDGGGIHKVCFSFEGLTLISLHVGAENLGLVTGNINQSLLTMVRAENIFLKQGAIRGAVGAPGAGRPDGGARGPAAEARA
ncbi:MAG TPA: hypothetical protein VK465_03895 [Fibrobacteria bacterium]|nr:hypothetical protein [Fibrobacteria bacterium]